MAYEYEGKLLDYASGSKTYEEYKTMSQELQEVYRKAKAFDEVLELHSQHIDKSSIYGNDLPLSVNKYEYYDDGLFAYEMYTLIKTYLEDE
ncbi:hypothetical protein [Staphylococcus saprophyticus]|uniref:hypothetical protein n=1 Tax=Staphylococcus saprophyticus TaxID=29385 RepID=UPI002DB879F9|nr:hypothetical protein [Staphylococcus saprophyticus]MEB6799941.1 DUF1024 family protein [Staphylococcus saprophyticus]